MIEAVYQWVAHNVAHNELFAGFAVAGLIGSIALYSKTALAGLHRLYQLQCTVYMSLQNTDEAFYWVNEWIAQHPYSRRNRRLRVVNKAEKRGEDSGGGSGAKGWSYSIADGGHWFFHKRRLLFVERTIHKEGSKGQDVMEQIDIRVLGRDRKVLLDILDEAFALMRAGDDATKIYTWSGHWWRRIAAKNPRPLRTVVMEPAAKAAVVDDMARFLKARDWYRARGIPYHRGYTFSGPPGTGKTSFVMALAHHFGRSLYVLNLSSILTDNELEDAFYGVPASGILVLEDIDAAQKKRERKKKKGKKKNDEADESPGASLSALLNCLDGLQTPDGLIVVMTTNFPDRLDAALLRPGRADMHVRFGPLDADLTREMFGVLFPEARDRLALPSCTPRTAAEIQGICMKHDGDADAAVQELEAA